MSRIQAPPPLSFCLYIDSPGRSDAIDKSYHPFTSHQNITTSFPPQPSPLLALPGEVRNLIFELAAGGRLIHDQTQWCGMPRVNKTHYFDCDFHQVPLQWKWTAGLYNPTGDSSFDRTEDNRSWSAYESTDDLGFKPCYYDNPSI